MSTSRPPIYLVNQGPSNRNVQDPPPLGILYVGQALREAGYQVRLFHLRGEKDERLKQAVKERKPLFVGFSNFIFPRLKRDIALSRWAKSQGVTVVWGGIFSTALPQVPLQSGCVDYIVVGEGERSAVQLAEALESGASPAGIPGVGYMEDGRPVVEPPAPPEPEIDKFGLGLDMLDLSEYVKENKAKGTRFLQVPFARGCPFRCSFCYNSMGKDRMAFRAHSADYMNDFLGYAKKKFGVNVIAFMCDNAFGKVKAAQEIIGQLDIKWAAATHVNIVSRDFLEWAQEAGCFRLSFGLESGSDRMLKMMNKNSNSEMIRDRLELCRQKGLYTISAWMGLCPDETREDMLATFSLMEEIHRTNPIHGMYYNVFRAYPHTVFGDRAVQLGFTMPETLDQWGGFDGRIYKLHGMSARQADRLWTLANSLYLRDRSAKGIANPYLRAWLRRRLEKRTLRGPVEESMQMASDLRRKIRG